MAQNSADAPIRRHVMGFEALTLLGLLVQQRWLFPVSDITANALGFVVMLAGLGGAGLLPRRAIAIGAVAAALGAHWIVPEPVRVTHLLINVLLIVVLAGRGKPRPALVGAVTTLAVAAAVEFCLPGAILWASAGTQAISDLYGSVAGSAQKLGATYFGAVPMVTFATYVGIIVKRSRPGAGWIAAAVAAAAYVLVWSAAVLFVHDHLGLWWLWLTAKLPIVGVPVHRHVHLHDPWLLGWSPLLLSVTHVVIAHSFSRAMAHLRDRPRTGATVDPRRPLPDGRGSARALGSDKSRKSKVESRKLDSSVRVSTVGSRFSLFRVPRWRYVMVGAAGLVVGVTPYVGEFETIQKRRVAIYNNGMLDWRLPDPEKYYGVKRSGMFGQFERMLVGLGLDVTKVNSFDALPPANETILILINPFDVSDDDGARIASFVRAGGGLLVLGDHTDMEGTGEQLGQALAFAGASYRFDSAFPAGRKWRNIYRAAAWSPAGGLGSSNERFQQSTGASLALSGLGWKPVVVGQYAFSDLGNRLNSTEGYLGDYVYQPGERLGDLTVVATRQVGAGRVAVFGDTSAFQNLGILRAWRMVYHVLCYVGAPGAWWPAFFVFAGSACALGWCLLRGSGTIRLGAFAATFLLGLSAASWLNGENTHGAGGVPEGLRPLAAVDATHHNAFLLEHFQVRSADGLFNNLLRNEYYPIAVFPPDRLGDVEAELYLVIAPMTAFSDGDIDALLRRVEGGATLVVSVGFEEASASAGLLHRLGIDVWPNPLGAVPIAPKLQDAAAYQRLRETPHFGEAWPLRWDEGVGWQSYYAWREHDLVAARRWGRGRVIVIGDSRFLLDETLETEGDYWPGNIKFFRSMLMTWPMESGSAVDSEAAP